MKSLWWHSNRKWRGWFEGSYEWVRKERIFVLKRWIGKKNHRVVYESWEAAKEAGWKKSV